MNAPSRCITWLEVNGYRYDLTLEATVKEALYAGGGGDYLEFSEVEESRVIDYYRDAINAALPDGFILAGDQFYVPADIAADDAVTLIQSALEVIDFWQLVEAVTG